MLHTSGPSLPYHVVAGVVPCRDGWLLASCKIAGVTLSLEDPIYFPKFAEVLDYRPSFEVIGVHAPIGYLDEPVPGGRTCDKDARALLGARRGAAIRSAPTRSLLNGAIDGGLDAVSGVLLPHFREIAEEVQSYRQRTVYEVEPELTFFELKGREPLRYSKRSSLGIEERTEILSARIQDVDRVLSFRLPGVKPAKLLDAVACMWSARRIYAKIGVRIPEDPEWDSEGVRMEIVC